MQLVQTFPRGEYARSKKGGKIEDGGVVKGEREDRKRGEGMGFSWEGIGDRGM